MEDTKTISGGERVPHVIRHGAPDDPRNYWWNGQWFGDRDSATVYRSRKLAEIAISSRALDTCFVEPAESSKPI